MPYLFLTCALCEVFLLWFLVALVRESRNSSRERGESKRARRAIKKGEVLPPDSQSDGRKPDGKVAANSVALLPIGVLVLVLALPLRAQETRAAPAARTYTLADAG